MDSQGDKLETDSFYRVEVPDLEYDPFTGHWQTVIPKEKLDALVAAAKTRVESGEPTGERILPKPDAPVFDAIMENSFWKPLREEYEEAVRQDKLFKEPSNLKMPPEYTRMMEERTLRWAYIQEQALMRQIMIWVGTSIDAAAALGTAPGVAGQLLASDELRAIHDDLSTKIIWALQINGDGILSQKPDLDSRLRWIGFRKTRQAAQCRKPPKVAPEKFVATFEARRAKATKAISDTQILSKLAAESDISLRTARRYLKQVRETK